jgi:predicted RNase H-like nuclease
VFSAPLRPTLSATGYAAACRHRRSIDGKAYSLQSFHLFPKIREVDRLVAGLGRNAPPDAAPRVAESHPETAFALMAGAPVMESKRSVAGRRRRAALLGRALPSCRPLLEAGPPKGARWDDFLDAVALVWSAGRIRAGRARAFPAAVPAPDSTGIIPRILV